jgi:hypothetical protein
MQLGVELGLSMVEIEETLFKLSKDMYSQTFDALQKWKTNREVKPTIRILMKAMQASEHSSQLVLIILSIHHRQGSVVVQCYQYL